MTVGCRSASGRALTGHNKLDRSISGPLSLGAAASANKQQGTDDFAADDLAGPTVEAENEDGLSEAEVRPSIPPLPSPQTPLPHPPINCNKLQ